MSLLQESIILLAMVESLWMAFDGGRALLRGDYVTPKTGKYAGRLGPWARVISALGIEPRSTPMKAFFLVYGAAWALWTALFAFGPRWAAWGMAAAAAGTLWYLVPGTVLSLLQLILLAIWIRTAG